MRKSLKLLLAMAAMAAVFVFSSVIAGAVEMNFDPADPRLAAHGLEIGPDGSLRFIDTVNITTQLWDRGHERIPDFTESYWAAWVAEQMLEVHNIAIEWIAVPRWGEGEHLGMLLGGDGAADVSFTFSFPIVQTFADMGAILNLTPLLEAYGDFLPNMYNLLTEDNVYWNLDPNTGHNWGMPGRLLADGRILTFVREDWLAALDLDEPTTLEEFEAMLEAFRDNAELLLGDNADRIIPMIVDHDVTWNVQALTENFLPNNMSERQWWVYGFDDRRFMHEDATREALRVFNRWYNNDLIWRDFVYHDADSPVGGDQIRLGFVGAFIANWDMPFRAADRWILDMHENVGPEANFIPIAPFPNESGQMVKYMPPPTDRSIFMPHTNRNPVAGLLYLDFMSRLDTRNFLAFGIEGVHHERLEDGAIRTLPFDDVPDEQFIPSLRNFDISLMVNGVDLSDVYLTGATLALGYPGISPEAIINARHMGLSRARIFPQVQMRPIAAQEGMSTPLADARDGAAHRVITASIDDFDTVWEAEWENYLRLGGRAIIAERHEAWIEAFGDVDNREGFLGWE
jgi:putative aldouronate transport system substrate-binding protein